MSVDALPFSLFTSKFKKKRVFHAAPDAQVLDLYRSRISTEFADFMAAEGFCSYADGLFTTIDPLVHRKPLAEFGANADMLVPLLKNAFGDLFYFDGVSVRILYVSHKEHHVLGSSNAVKMLFLMRITESDFQRPFLKKKGFTEAMKVHGPLSSTESYGHYPLVPAGGPEQVANIRKVDTLVYLSELAQAFRG